jgi:DnaJ-class molecular chaperone
VKQYHPDVVKDMDKDEAEHRFIALQSAYELLTDEERRAEYDKEHREHPLAANQAFQAYMARRKKAFDQRGDLAMVRVMKTNVA